jgi:hypothetical protein
MKANTIGTWVITNGKDQFFNPRAGTFDNFFIPSKHLFTLWGTVDFKMKFYKGCKGYEDIRVQKVELNPVYSDVEWKPL